MELQRSGEESTKNNDVSEDSLQLQELLNEKIKEVKKHILDNDIAWETLQTRYIETKNENKQLQDKILRLFHELDEVNNSLKEREMELNTGLLISKEKERKLKDLIENDMQEFKELSEDLEDKLGKLKVDRELLMQRLRQLKKLKTTQASQQMPPIERTNQNEQEGI
ncbi:uncharacterized protein [Temnothorax nylanderi]|uniref:uncharacterized protein n=1 Tax=Temnothorax nylanderi TaxID=102681 RepID=UPI003A8C1448